MAFGLQNIGMDKAEVQRQGAEPPPRCCGWTHCCSASPPSSPAASASAWPSAVPSCANRRIFLFDEPLSNLDAELRVADSAARSPALHQRLGATMIYVTHDQVEAMTMADKIVVLSARAGSSRSAHRMELYNKPANLFVAGFIGSPRMNFVPVSRTGEREVATRHGSRLNWPAALPAGGTELELGVRPEHLSLNAAEGSLALPMNITQVEQLGGHALLYGILPDGSTSLTAQVAGQHAARPGDSVTLHAPASACHLFAADGLRLGGEA